MIIETTRQIIDAVRPTHSFYTLETMPWMYPDSVESYIALFNAIDRPRFAVHLDPVNLVCSPQRYFNNAALLHTFFEHLGPHIRSCHAKDILLADRLTTHLDEVIPRKRWDGLSLVPEASAPLQSRFTGNAGTPPGARLITSRRQPSSGRQLLTPGF